MKACINCAFSPLGQHYSRCPVSDRRTRPPTDKVAEGFAADIKERGFCFFWYPEEMHAQEEAEGKR